MAEALVGGIAALITKRILAGEGETLPGAPPRADPLHPGAVRERPLMMRYDDAYDAHHG